MSNGAEGCTLFSSAAVQVNRRHRQFCNVHTRICTCMQKKGWEIRWQLNVPSSAQVREKPCSVRRKYSDDGWEAFCPSSDRMLLTNNIICSLEVLPAFLPAPPPPAQQKQTQIPFLPDLQRTHKQMPALSALLCCLMLDSTNAAVPAALDFWSDWRLSHYFSSAQRHCCSLLPDDCCSYVVLQTSTVQRQFHLSETWDDWWVDFSKCLC